MHLLPQPPVTGEFVGYGDKVSVDQDRLAVVERATRNTYVFIRNGYGEPVFESMVELPNDNGPNIQDIRLAGELLLIATGEKLYIYQQEGAEWLLRRTYDEMLSSYEHFDLSGEYLIAGDTSGTNGEQHTVKIFRIDDNFDLGLVLDTENEFTPLNNSGFNSTEGDLLKQVVINGDIAVALIQRLHDTNDTHIGPDAVRTILLFIQRDPIGDTWSVLGQREPYVSAYAENSEFYEVEAEIALDNESIVMSIVDTSPTDQRIEALLLSKDFQGSNTWHPLVALNPEVINSAISAVAVNDDFMSVVIDGLINFIDIETAETQDGDADYHIDLIDNCLINANEDQTDTDNDGYGNRCDADFTND
ncbi:MAG: hypothetical protein HKM24_06530, partial [Gammaproteobacteria bacterium]|nr:hypothetical protein [Gammaproteobacteria bacterium]